MGGVESKPINATIELCIESGEDKVRHNGARGALNSSGLGKKGQENRKGEMLKWNQERGAGKRCRI